MNEEGRFDIVCRDREEFIEDYLMEVTEHDRKWAEQMADVYIALSGGPDELFPCVLSPEEDLLF